MEISMKAQGQGHRKGHNYNFPSEGDFFLYSNLRSPPLLSHITAKITSLAISMKAQGNQFTF